MNEGEYDQKDIEDMQDVLVSVIGRKITKTQVKLILDGMFKATLSGQKASVPEGAQRSAFSCSMPLSKKADSVNEAAAKQHINAAELHFSRLDKPKRAYSITKQEKVSRWAAPSDTEQAEEAEEAEEADEAEEEEMFQRENELPFNSPAQRPGMDEQRRVINLLERIDKKVAFLLQKKKDLMDIYRVKENEDAKRRSTGRIQSLKRIQSLRQAFRKDDDDEAGGLP